MFTVLRFEVLVKDKLKVIEVEIADINNDNSPSFPVKELELKIAENTSPGAQFLLPEAQDPDLGTNSLHAYHLGSNEHFSLDVQTGIDCVECVELALEKLLDQEEQKIHQLILTGSDKGNPVRSRSVQVRIAVSDINDNAPVFKSLCME